MRAAAEGAAAASMPPWGNSPAASVHSGDGDQDFEEIDVPQSRVPSLARQRGWASSAVTECDMASVPGSEWVGIRTDLVDMSREDSIEARNHARHATLAARSTGLTADALAAAELAAAATAEVPPKRSRTDDGASVAPTASSWTVCDQPQPMHKARPKTPPGPRAPASSALAATSKAPARTVHAGPAPPQVQAPQDALWDRADRRYTVQDEGGGYQCPPQQPQQWGGNRGASWSGGGKGDGRRDGWRGDQWRSHSSNTWRGSGSRDPSRNYRGW